MKTATVWLFVGSIVLCGCMKIVTPDRVYLEGADSLAVKIIHTERNDQLEKEYAREATILREQVKALSDSIDSLALQILELDTQFQFQKQRSDTLEVQKSKVEAMFVLYKALYDECIKTSARK